MTQSTRTRRLQHMALPLCMLTCLMHTLQQPIAAENHSHEPSSHEISCHAADVLRRTCCNHKQPSSPHERNIRVTFFVATRNDGYGGYPSVVRSSAAVASLVWGITHFDLLDGAEIIVVDWNSDNNARCTSQYSALYATTPMVCSGSLDDRTCRHDMLRIITVSPSLAQRYAPAPVSEVHTFNIAVRKARGQMLLRVDQDTFTHAPFFRWLAWQKRHGWPDINAVWWAPRDGDLRKAQVPLATQDLRFHMMATMDASCPLQDGPPKRKPYNESEAVGSGCSWRVCHNGAVGVYGYPVELMKEVRGMNETFYHWGGMEAELCTRAKKSAKFVTWIDVSTELCGRSFSHLEHDYTTEKRLQNGAQGSLAFDNDENWGLANVTLHEHVY